MNIIITGVTGVVGSETVRQALLNPRITRLTAISRRPISIQHEKLRVIILKNFLDYSDIMNDLKVHDACLWCLGVSQNQVRSDEEYHTITHDYAISAANAMLSVNPNIVFGFVSGLGADTTEKSKMLFARVKGKTENALLKLPFKQLYLFRPGGIQPIQKKENPMWYEYILNPILFPLMRLVVPTMVITSVELAKVMIHILFSEAPKTILENKDLRNIIHEFNIQ
ncbi:MAG: epimerase [Bacteroidota bacterium]|nr:epimerase [Bacteroidota bacterium]